MEYTFTKGIITKVPIGYLIEDYQGLLKAVRGLRDGTMLVEDVIEEIECVMECLADSIDKFTPKTDKLSPSVSTAISMDIEDGLITQPDGSDLLCAAGKPVSQAMAGGVCQCSEECQRIFGCCPEDGITRMSNSFLYVRNPSTAEDLLES